ncbi:hypothetical protein D3C86_1315270 [compost metagenome]
MVVTVQRHEDLVVVLDQRLPQHQAVGHFQRADAIRADIEQLVGREDDRHLRVALEYVARPGDGGVGGAPRHRQHHEAVAVHLEEVVLVEARRIAAAEGGLALRTGGRERLQVRLVGQVALRVGV